MKKLFLLFSVAALTAGCEKQITFSGEDARTRIVLHSFLSPDDTTIVATLSESRSILESNDEYPPVRGADVRLFKNGQFAGTLQENTVEKNGEYYFFEEVEPGVRYAFEVSHPTLEAVGSSTQVPATAPNFSAELIDTQGDELILEVQVQDQPGDQKFIMLLFEEGFSQNYPLSYSSSNPFLKTPYEDTGPGASSDSTYFIDGEAFFTDNHFKNGVYTFRVSFSLLDLPWLPQQLIVHMKHVSHDYYLYRFGSQLQLWNQGDPFAQPVPVHNNVSNGIGCVGSFFPNEVKVDL